MSDAGEFQNREQPAGVVTTHAAKAGRIATVPSTPSIRAVKKGDKPPAGKALEVKLRETYDTGATFFLLPIPSKTSAGSAWLMQETTEEDDANMVLQYKASVITVGKEDPIKVEVPVYTNPKPIKAGVELRYLGKAAQEKRSAVGVSSALHATKKQKAR